MYIKASSNRIVKAKLKCKNCNSTRELLLELSADTNDNPHWGQLLSAWFSKVNARALLQRMGELLQ